MKKLKYLKQYKTKDGLLSKIEECDEANYREVRAVYNYISPLSYGEGESDLNCASNSGTHQRSYVVKKQIPCLLFIYEED